MSAFGTLLLRYRRRAGLSQEDLSGASGVSVRALRELERGRAHAAQRRSAQALADALGLEGDERDLFLVTAEEGRRRTSQVSQLPALCALPPAVTDLAGRERELASLRADAQAGGVVAIVGQPGVGKTALAVTAAHDMAPAFPAGCLAVDLRGMDEHPVPPRTALDSLLRALGVPGTRIPPGDTERSTLFRVLAESRKILLLLDNAADENQVRPLVVTGAGCLTLVTCRQTLAGLESVRRLWLSPLTNSAAVGLLAGIAGEDRIDAEAEATRELVDLCGHLPLAVRIAGNRLATRPHWSLDYLVSRLRDEQTRLSALAVGDLQTRSAFEVSYRRLSPMARLVFRRLATIPGADFGAELAATATGMTPADVAAPLDELADACLLQTTPGAGRFQLHDLIRIFADERLAADDEPAARDRIRDAVLDHLLATATAAARMFRHGGSRAPGTGPVRSRDEAAQWLMRETSNWTAAQRVATRLELHRDVIDLAEAMHWSTARWVPELPWDQICELGLTAARAMGDRLAEAKLLNQLGWAQHVCIGDVQAALATHAEALAVAEEVGDRHERAWAHGWLAIGLVRLGRVEEGLEHSRRAAALARDVGHLVLQLSSRNVLGIALQASGRHAEALAVHRDLLAEVETRQDELEPELVPWGKMLVLDEIGACLAHLGDWRAAAHGYREARSLLSANGIGYRAARSALNEGKAWRKAGEYALARESLRLALEFFTEPLYRAERDDTVAELAQLPEEP